MSDQGEQWGVPTIHTWLLLPKAPLSKGTFLGTGEHQCYHSDRLGSSPKRTGQWHSALLYEPDSFLDQCGIWCKRMREFVLALKKKSEATISLQITSLPPLSYNCYKSLLSRLPLWLHVLLTFFAMSQGFCAQLLYDRFFSCSALLAISSMFLSFPHHWLRFPKRSLPPHFPYSLHIHSCLLS